VGLAAGTYTYEWSTTPTDGGQIELNAKGLIIRDINCFNTTTPATMVTVGIGAAGANILKGQTLTLERGVTLTAHATNAITFFGDAADAGANLLGPGRILAVAAATSTNPGTEITGGDYGWQAVGADNIAITAPTDTLKVEGVSSASPPAAVNTASLTALGLGATITVQTAKTLNIAADTTINLNGSYQRKAGAISLPAAGGLITFAADPEARILTGAGSVSPTTIALVTGASTLSGSTLDGIGVPGLQAPGTPGTNKVYASTTAVVNATGTPSIGTGRLISLIGGTGTCTITTTGAVEVIISSETPTNPN
jgi:hypothetical protein